MLTTTERRLSVLRILCERRRETIDNLAFELEVSRTTIKTDILVLSMSYPIYSVSGVGGGIRVVDGFNLGTKYLTDTQCELLERLSTILEGTDKETLHSILKTFKKPEIKPKGKN